MNYQIKLQWNDTICLMGLCTASAGIEAARNFIACNFTGIEAVEYMSLLDKSAPLDRLAKSGFVAFDYADSTGKACAVVHRT